MRIKNNLSLKKLLQSGQKVIGTWCEIPSPELTNVIAKSGMDFVILDMEHGVIDFKVAAQMVISAQTEGCFPLIRIPKNDESDILRTLETGAEGIIVPHVEFPTDRTKAIQYLKYPPLGNRSLNPYTRAGSYHSYSGYCKEQNEKTLLGLIIEGPEGIKNVEKIIDDKNVDLVYIGVYDISSFLGIPGDTKNPRVLDTLKKLVRIVRKKHKAAGCMFHNEEELKIFRRMDIQLFCYKVDTSVIFDEFSNIKKIAKL